MSKGMKNNSVECINHVFKRSNFALKLKVSQFVIPYEIQ